MVIGPTHRYSTSTSALNQSSEQTGSLLSLENVRFGYEPRQIIIEDFTAELSPGQVCTLIGPNAAGKSTLLRLVLGQLSPNSGTVKIDGQNVQSLRPGKRASWMSYVPQRPRASFAFTVEQVVAMGRFALASDWRAVSLAIEACDLTSLRDRVYTRLSAGQQQRVVLARAMVQTSGGGRLMLLDEPGSAMDLWHLHRTMRLLRRLARRGLAVLVVVHDLNLAARYADTVWLMDQGRLLASGSWQQVLQPQLLQPVYRMSLNPVAQDEDGRPLFRADPPATIIEGQAN